MNQASFKPRNGYSGFTREQAARHKSSGGGGGFGGSGGQRTVGLYDSYYPKMPRLWISLCPTQRWVSEFYDKQAKEVVTLEAEYLAYVMHKAKHNRFVCSSTAHQNKPCYGCSERRRFYVKRDEVRAELGHTPDEYKNAPLMSLQQFSLSLTILEEMGEFPKVAERNGVNEIVKSRKDAIIYDWVPTRLMKGVKVGGKDVEPRAKSFGHRFHWSFGPDHLTALIAENEVLSTHCANCASPLSALYGQCRSQLHDGESFDAEGNPILEDCGHIVLDEPIPHDALFEVSQAMHDCANCGETDKLDYGYCCDNCGLETRPGSIFDFELQIGATGPEDHTPKVYGFRPRQDYSKISGYEELIYKPLDLKEIHAPEKLQWQLNRLPEHRRKLASPDAHIRQGDNAGPDDALGEGETAPINY